LPVLARSRWREGLVNTPFADAAVRSLLREHFCFETMLDALCSAPPGCPATSVPQGPNKNAGRRHIHKAILSGPLLVPFGAVTFAQAGADAFR
jgi:hypothetical protein